MSVKFTTPQTDLNKIKLLFEFLDYELPEKINIDYVSKLGKTMFVNNFQTNQVMGVYLQPINIEAEFVGTYWSSEEKKQITANERSEQLRKLQGHVVKFFFDNFKQIVIIENFKKKIHNQEHVEVEITLQPHDIMYPISPSETEKLSAETIDLLENSPINKTDLPPNVDEDLIKEAKEEKTLEKIRVESHQNKVEKAANLNIQIKTLATEKIKQSPSPKEKEQLSKIIEINNTRLDHYEKAVNQDKKVQFNIYEDMENDLRKLQR